MNLVEYFKQRLVNDIFEGNAISAPPRPGPPPNPPIPVQPGPPRPQGPRPGPTAPGPSRPPRPPGPAPVNPGGPRPNTPRASKIKNVNEARRRYENDPHNYGLPPQPGSLVSHGDVFDRQDIIDHHVKMLHYAVQTNDQGAIAKHVKAIESAGGNAKEILHKITGN